MTYLEEQINERRIGETEKPIVFLIGDSIRMGYCETVRADLADAAEVVYPEENCRFSQNILTSLRGWTGLCDPQKVRLVQFNSGHWDAAHWNDEDVPLNSPEVYGQNIRRIIASLRRFFPNARVIFATTTPMNPNGENSVNFRTTAEILRYNEAGVKAADECGVMVSDLYAFTKDWPCEAYADYCHFRPEFFAKIGHYAADVLRRELQCLSRQSLSEER